MRHNNCNVKPSLGSDVNDSSPIEKKLVQSRLQFKSMTTTTSGNKNKRKLCKSEESDSDANLANVEDGNGSNSNTTDNSSDYKDDDVAASLNVSIKSPKILIKLPKPRKSDSRIAPKDLQKKCEKLNHPEKQNPNKRVKLEFGKGKDDNDDEMAIEIVDLNSDSSSSIEPNIENKEPEKNISLNITGTDSDVKFEDNSSNNAESVTAVSVPLSPSKDRKSVKLSKERRRVRDKKEVKLQEERLKASTEKEKRELLKKQEREKKVEERKKEREEKENQRRLEREEKEKKRLADLNAKTEEKRKKTEAKEEELRKKEEERKRKEQEKEEAEFKKKKAAEGFKKFFVAKDANTSQEYENLSKAHDNCTQMLAFRPFEVKGDMQLAPVCRKTISVESKLELDSLLHMSDNSLNSSQHIDMKRKAALYLSQINTGSIIPIKYRKASLDKKEAEEDDDICIIDDLERAGQAIEENHTTVEQHRAKFLKFFENRRPAYFGTWRKKTSVITPKRPFAKDEKFFDYEVDSDLDWEEEEPGESLDGSDDEKEKESEDDDYEVDNEWFVPHGHLSDEELQTEFENGLSSANDREAQKVKLKIKQQEFAIQMKKKTEKLKPRLLGCIWVDENGNQPKDFPNLIWNTLYKRSMIFSTALSMDEPEESIGNQETGSPTNIVSEKLKPIVLNDELLKDLIRLVHGNSNSKSFLIKEYIAYIETNENSIKNGVVRGPLKSMVREKIDEFAEWTVIEDSDTTKKNNKNKVKKRLCWIVADHILSLMNMKELTLNNTWSYILQPKSNVAIKSKENI